MSGPAVPAELPSGQSSAQDRRDQVVGVVVTGDNHLSPSLPRMSPLRRQERRAWLRRAFLEAVDYALARKAALFVNTGDLFDSPAPSNQDRAFVAEQLHRLRAANIACVAISGNHDTPRMHTEHGGDAPQQVYAANDDLHYFASTDTLEARLFTLGALSVAIVGLSVNPVASPGSDPLANASWSPDAEATLARADVALLTLHAAIEGMARPGEGERTVTRASLAALPESVRVVAAGHIHRFTRQRMGEREVVVVGATERMEFGAPSVAPGFVWIELTRDGARRIEHIRTQAQPRADITLHTSALWPDEDADHSADASDSAAANPALEVIRARLESACTPETLARLRLTGELTRARYQQLALRDVIALGQQIAFTLDVDTSGLRLQEPAFALPSLGPRANALSPTQMIALVVEDTLRERATGDASAAALPDPDDLRAASALLLARLRSGGEEGA